MRFMLLVCSALAFSYSSSVLALQTVEVDTSSQDLTIEDMDRISKQQRTPEEVLQLECPNNARACTKYGMIALKGSATLPRDDVAARKYLGFGCNMGDPVGCRTLGLAQLQGRGGPVDGVEARISLKKSCDGKDAKGCAGLAQMHGRGLGGAVDKDSEKLFLGKACDLGEQPICAMIGRAIK
jgi:uncharacterized protein